MMEGFRTKFGKGMMELVGTAVFLCTIQLAIASSSSLAPLAIGGVLVTLVYAGGPISGAHYNPAISLAIAWRGKMSGHGMAMYWMFQVLGGWLGAFVGGIIGGSFASVSQVATHSQVENNHYYGAAIGLVVTAGAVAVGPISGGAFNPAVALGLNLSSMSLGPYVIGVIVANLLGGMAAAACFYMVAPEEFDAVGASSGETTNLVS